MKDMVKEILLKQMELLYEESKKADGYEAARNLASMSSAMAELANVLNSFSVLDAASELQKQLNAINC